MRYFKYKKTGECYKNNKKYYYRSLGAEEKRRYKINKIWKTAAAVVGTTVFIAGFIASNIFIGYNMPKTENVFLGGLIGFAYVIVVIILMILLAVIAYFASLPFVRLADKYLVEPPEPKIFSHGCKHLRDYYGVKDPYILTKCYDSSDKTFINHDVCLFVADGELRITTDLIKGFLYGDKDLGCYTFKREEISLVRKDNGKLMAVELRAKVKGDDDVVFLLSYRANGFIKKNFLNYEK